MTLIGHWEIIIKQCIFNIQLSRNVGSFYFQNKGLVISVNKLKFNLTLFQTVKGVKKFILMVMSHSALFSDILTYGVFPIDISEKSQSLGSLESLFFGVIAIFR